MKLTLKEVLYIFFNVAKDMVTTAFLPLITTSIKMSVVAGLIWLTLNYVPHNLDVLKGLNFASCIVAVICVRLLLFRYDDFDDAPAEDVITPDYLKDEEPPKVEEEPQPQVLQEQTLPPPNIRRNLEPDESARE